MKIDLYKMTIDVSTVLAVRISRMPARRFFQRDENEQKGAVL